MKNTKTKLIFGSILCLFALLPALASYGEEEAYEYERGYGKYYEDREHKYEDYEKHEKKYKQHYRKAQGVFVEPGRPPMPYKEEVCEQKCRLDGGSHCREVCKKEDTPFIGIPGRPPMPKKEEICEQKCQLDGGKHCKEICGGRSPKNGPRPLQREIQTPTGPVLTMSAQGASQEMKKMQEERRSQMQKRMQQMQQMSSEERIALQEKMEKKRAEMMQKLQERQRKMLQEQKAAEARDAVRARMVQQQQMRAQMQSQQEATTEVTKDKVQAFMEKIQPKLEAIAEKIETRLVNADTLSVEEKIDRLKTLQERLDSWARDNYYRALVADYLKEKINGWLASLGAADDSVDQLDTFLNDILE